MSAPLHPSATLLASRLTLAHGDNLVLDDVSLTVAAGHRIRRGRSERGGQVQPARRAGRLPPARPTAPASTRPRRRWGCFGTRARHRARPVGPGAPGPAHRGRPRRGRADGGRSRPGARTSRVPTIATRAALGRFVSLSDGELDARIDVAWRPRRRRGFADTPTRQPLGRAGLQGRPGRDRAVPLRRHPPRRAHQRPRLRGTRAAGGSSSARPGGVVVVPTTATSSAGPSPTCSSRRAHHRGSLFGGGWYAYLEQRETDRRHAEEAYRTYETSDASSGDGPAASGSGPPTVSPGRRGAPRTTTRRSGTSGSTAPSSWPREARRTEARARGARGRREAVGGLAAPLPHRAGRRAGPSWPA